MKKFYDAKNEHIYSARSLPVDCIGQNDSGWTFKADIQEDWYEWVSYFESFHPDYGIVYGDFEDKVRASSKEAYKHFIKHHPFEDWDYGDI